MEAGTCPVWRTYFGAVFQQIIKSLIEPPKSRLLGRDGEHYSSSVLSTSLFVSLRTLLTLSCLIFTFAPHDRTSYHQPSRISAALL